LDFPFSSRHVARVANPANLANTLNHAGKFTAEEDTVQPQLAQVEARDGALWSSDRFAVSLVEFPAAPEMSIRVNTKDISSVVRFLAEADSDVEVLENAKTSFFRCTDGSVFGVARPPIQFPKLNIDRQAEPAATFDLPVDDMRDAISQLSAAAAKDDRVLNIRHDDGNLVLSMDAEADGHCEFPITGVNITNGDVFEGPGFNIEYNYLQALAESFDLDTLGFGVHPVGGGGYLSFLHTGESATDEDPNTYYTVIVWKT
jgi:DNA polymerase III sliding clamp (beta) subunit (PCNA family)